MKSRYVCLHGHFYQPPRENPWTGKVERQPSAGEDHDWNARIARECYIPNGRARIAGEGNKTLAVINNYSYLSFNFGPTLLTWYEKAHPAEYARLLEADRASARRLEGHGNAIAQAYGHMILPLANPRDRLTQVLWGLADFRFRFGRQAEALWLPETACDDEVLRTLIDCGMKYAILAPSQAARARRIGAADWADVSSGGLDVRHPYRWFDGRSAGKRHIDLFFYHAPLSQDVAFGRLMADSSACARRIAAEFSAHSKSSQLLSIATDGETYGHHDAFADMGLAHLFKHALPRHRLVCVNYGYYLSKHPPRWEAEIKRGPQGLGTSWSCAHGVGRWMDDCGCGALPGTQQRWRGPLREALDWLRDRLVCLCEKKGERLFRDLWRARDEYIQVILRPEEAVISDFLSRQLREEAAPRARAQALRLMKIQELAQYMYASCGWFFAEISGLEATQNLKYAARAIELAKQASGEDLEREFLSRLKLAPSNSPEFGSAAGVYERLVLPSRS